MSYRPSSPSRVERWLATNTSWQRTTCRRGRSTGRPRDDPEIENITTTLDRRIAELVPVLYVRTAYDPKFETRNDGNGRQILSQRHGPSFHTEIPAPALPFSINFLSRARNGAGVEGKVDYLHLWKASCAELQASHTCRIVCNSCCISP